MIKHLGPEALSLHKSCITMSCSIIFSGLPDSPGGSSSASCFPQPGKGLAIFSGPPDSPGGSSSASCFPQPGKGLTSLEDSMLRSATGDGVSTLSGATVDSRFRRMAGWPTAVKWRRRRAARKDSAAAATASGCGPSRMEFISSTDSPCCVMSSPTSSSSSARKSTYSVVKTPTACASVRLRPAHRRCACRGAGLAHW